MRPTSMELLDSIAQALEDQVLPVVQDKWGASTLRSAMQLLRHLALRVALEPRILAADNDDVRRVLSLAYERLGQLGETDLAATAAAVLSSPLVDPLDVAAADALNETYLRAVEAIVLPEPIARQRDRLIGHDGGYQTCTGLVGMFGNPAHQRQRHRRRRHQQILSRFELQSDLDRDFGETVEFDRVNRCWGGAFVCVHEI